MPACSAFGCTNRPDRDRMKGITFHQFPKHTELNQQWVKAVRRENFTPSKRSVLCSAHFREEDIDRTSLNCVRLREGVIPTLFDSFPSYLQTSYKKHRKAPVDRIQPTTPQVIIEELEQGPSLPPRSSLSGNIKQCASQDKICLHFNIGTGTTMEEDEGPVPQMLFINQAFLHSNSLEPNSTMPEVTKDEGNQNDCYSQHFPHGIKTEILTLDYGLSSQCSDEVVSMQRNFYDSNQISYNAAGIVPYGLVSSHGENDEIKIERKEECILTNNSNEIKTENVIIKADPDCVGSIDSGHFKVENDCFQSRQIPDYPMKCEMASMNDPEIKVERDEEPEVPFSNACRTPSVEKNIIPSHVTSLEMITSKEENMQDCLDSCEQRKYEVIRVKEHCDTYKEFLKLGENTNYEQRKDEGIKVEEHCDTEMVSLSTTNCHMKKSSMEQTDLGQRMTIYPENRTEKFSICNESNENEHRNEYKTMNRNPLYNETNADCSSLKLVASEHSRETCFKCTFCEKPFISKRSLACHVKRHTSEYTYKCNSCERAYTSKSDLRRHLKTHTGEKRYKCTTCDKAFTERFILADHVRTHTGEKPYKCNICDKSFILNRVLTKHMKIHTGEKPYKCTVCNKAFIERYQLSRHVTTHTGETRHKCDICYKAFICNSKLTKHMLGHTGERPYKCDLCDKAFTHNYLLTKHKTIHTGQRPFKCTTCDKTFIERNLLEDHLKIHTGEKPYKCTICCKAFSNMAQLRYHMIKHTRERSHKCTFCDKAYFFNCLLTNHMKKHTGKQTL